MEVSGFQLLILWHIFVACYGISLVCFISESLFSFCFEGVEQLSACGVEEVMLVTSNGYRNSFLCYFSVFYFFSWNFNLECWNYCFVLCLYLRLAFWWFILWDVGNSISLLDDDGFWVWGICVLCSSYCNVIAYVVLSLDFLMCWVLYPICFFSVFVLAVGYFIFRWLVLHCLCIF